MDPVHLALTVPEYLSLVWNWIEIQDPRVTFGCGVLFWMIVRGAFSIFANPLQKVLAVAGFILVCVIALVSWVAFTASLEPGSVPFSKATETPGVNTLKEIGQ